MADASTLAEGATDSPKPLRGDRDGRLEREMREALAPADSALRDGLLAGHRFRELARRAFHNDQRDRLLFILFAVAGCGFVFAAKSVGMGTGTTECVAVGLLFAYAGFSWSSPRFRLHPDRLGDNCYYMGFLFTLASLSGALIVLQNSSEAARGSLLESLLGSFGVALFTTIAGIATRVFFMQMHREIEDVEETMRRELQEAARLLKDQLGDAVRGLETFRLRTQQVMDEQFNSMFEEFSSAARKLSEQVAASGEAHERAGQILARSSQNAVSTLARAVETMSAQTQEVSTVHERTTERLVGSAETLLIEVARLVQRVDAIEVPSDLLTRQVEDARLRIAGLVGALVDVAKADGKRQTAMAKAAASLDSVLVRLADLKPFEGIESSAVRLKDVVDDANMAMEGLGERLSSHSAAFGRLAQQADDGVAAMARARSSVEADLIESTAALRKLQGALGDVAERLVDRLGAG